MALRIAERDHNSAVDRLVGDGSGVGVPMRPELRIRPVPRIAIEEYGLYGGPFSQFVVAAAAIAEFVSSVGGGSHGHVAGRPPYR